MTSDFPLSGSRNGGRSSGLRFWHLTETGGVSNEKKETRGRNGIMTIQNIKKRKYWAKKRGARAKGRNKKKERLRFGRDEVGTREELMWYLGKM